MTSLSKSKILLHRQCPKRLWLQINHPELVHVNPAIQARLNEGNKVGDIARQNYPGGLFVNTLNQSEALSLTKDGIKKHQAIFEAAFFEDDVLIRADLLLPEKDSYRLVEVKSSTAVKDYHLDDVSVQTWVMDKAGCKPSKVSLAYINNQFVYQGDGNYTDLFLESDLTDQVSQNLSQVEGWVASAQKTLSSIDEPNIIPGDQCESPFTCDFINYCSPTDPNVEYPVEILPNGKTKAAELRAKGYKDLRDVPVDLLNNPKHIKVHAVTLSGVASLESHAVKEIQALPYPRYYLDFETIAFAVPVWAGTRPYMQIPFQWSCHIEDANGAIRHSEFLDVSGNDPRLQFANSLIDVMGKNGTVIVYNAGFEGARIKELAEAFPSLSSQLLAITKRFFDLLPLARNHYYHPNMKGSWSIKQVLPTIAPELDYSNLEIGDGGMAQDAYKEVIDLPAADDRRNRLRTAMLKYCEQDTLAMVKIVGAWAKA